MSKIRRLLLLGMLLSIFLFTLKNWTTLADNNLTGVTKYWALSSPLDSVTVSIDILPGIFPNEIDPSSYKAIVVVIYSSNRIDATTIDPNSVLFGPAGATTKGGQFIFKDANHDGKKDLALFFRPSESGIQCGASNASLTGSTFYGLRIEGSDSIITINCVPRTIKRVSIATDGTEANEVSWGPALSDNGRFIAFASAASNLVPNDTNGMTNDVFVHDLLTGEIILVSIASDGTQSNSYSTMPDISADGQVIVFHSGDSNLVPDDNNGYTDVFVHDRTTGQTTRVSVSTEGTQGNGHSLFPAISADGRFVAFHSYATNLASMDTFDMGEEVFVHDRLTGETTLVSTSYNGSWDDNASRNPSISGDGRFIAFESNGANIVPNDTNGEYDIFVHDRQTGETVRVSVATDGTQSNGFSGNPSISADGRFVAFGSSATNLVPNDTNGQSDIFVHDMLTGKTTLVSIASDGTQSNGKSNLSEISADGQYVAFESSGSNLIANETNGYPEDIFVHNRLTGSTTIASTTSEGIQGFFESFNPTISGDGQLVGFASLNPLVPNDTNWWDDVFVCYGCTD